MTGRSWLAALTILAATGAGAAPAVTVKVAADGRLQVPPQVVRKLGLKQKRGQLICVQFPKAPAKPAKPKSPDQGHAHAAAPVSRPPRIYTGLRNDGGLTVPKTRVPTLNGSIPGKPGTAYRLAVHKGILVLTPIR